jgi:carbamoyltransferase
MKRQYKYFVGISLGFNSSAALVDDRGQLIRAISEERLIREKNTKKIPTNAINFVKPFETDQYDMSTCLWYTHYDNLDEAYFKKYQPDWDYIKEYSPEQNLLHLINIRCGLAFDTISRVDHHTAHAYSVFPYYKVPRDSLIITSDGYGDGYSQKMFETKDMTYCTTAQPYLLKDSIALVYQFVTGALGLKMHQHEGKVTGLAGHGKHNIAMMLLDLLYAKHSTTMYKWDYKKNTFADLQQDIFQFCYEWLKVEPCDVVIDISKEDIASLCLMAQLFIEREFIRRLNDADHIRQDQYHLFLAGGLFANVKLNSLIARETKFKSVNVAPPMGDEGGAVGAVLSQFKPFQLVQGQFCNVYSGVPMEYSNHNIKLNQAEWERSVSFIKYGSEKLLIKEMARLLAEGQIVHYRSGSSEFGPRALCHSTTFYQPSDPDGTKYLNKTLGRSEYMPYAPIVLDKDVDRLFIRNRKLDKTNQYMTAILEWRDNEPPHKYAGALHVDLTARPQILYDKKSFAYRLLKEYKKLTGLSMLINTSWNIHGNPTVALSDDSKLTWMESGFCGGALIHDMTMYKARSITHDVNI